MEKNQKKRFEGIIKNSNENAKKYGKVSRKNKMEILKKVEEVEKKIDEQNRNLSAMMDKRINLQEKRFFTIENKIDKQEKNISELIGNKMNTHGKMIDRKMADQTNRLSTKFDEQTKKISRIICENGLKEKRKKKSRDRS